MDEILYESEWQGNGWFWDGSPGSDMLRATPDGEHFWMAEPDARGAKIILAWKGLDEAYFTFVGKSKYGYNHAKPFSRLKKEHPDAMWSWTHRPAAMEDGFDWFDEPSMEVNAHYWVVHRESKAYYLIWVHAHDKAIMQIGFNADRLLIPYSGMSRRSALQQWQNMFPLGQYVYTPIPRPRNPYFGPRDAEDAKRYQDPMCKVIEVCPF